MSDTIATYQVDVRCQDPEGNDPWEAAARLPIVPRKGDSLEVWIQEPESFRCRPEFLDVMYVALSTWEPERIEVWVSTDGHSDADMARIFRAIKDGDQP